MSSSTDWMPNGGAPLLPKVSPYCVPERQMELKRRPTLYDIRGSGWQMRHYKAPIDAEVPWERVHFWPSKDVHVITEQEVIQPPMPKMTRTRTRTVAQKGPKVVKAPSTPVRQKKVAPKFALRYDYWRVFNYFNKIVFGAQAGQGAVEAAPADAPDVVQTTPSITCSSTLPGAVPDDAAAAADVDAQTESAADDEAQPSLLAAIFNFGIDFVLGQRKRAHEDDDDVAGDAKRRRVGSDAQAPSSAEARPAAGDVTTTGTTVPKYHYLTAVAAQRRDRRKPKPSRALCPPPTDSAAGDGNTNVATARPIAGRPTRRRADTPDPRVGIPPPSEREMSSAPSTPTSSPSSSRASTPERERSSSPSPSPSPSPAPKSSKSKSKSSSSKSKSKSTKSASSSGATGELSSDSESSSSKSKASSSKSKTSSSKSKSSSSGSKSSSASKSSSSKSQSSSSKTQPSSSGTQASSSKSQGSHKSSSRRSSTEHTTDASSRPRPRSGTEIMLYPHFIYWNRDDKLANPWDPRCAAAPDPLFPWAPASQYWANARCAPIAPLPDQSPEPPSFRLERAPANPLYPSPAPRRRHRSPSPVREREREAERGELSGAETEQLSGAETEVESGGEETDCEE